MDYDLNPTEAAQRLGIHEDTLKRYARDGKIAAFRTPGGWWKFSQADLDAFIEAGRSETTV
jgi:excisionase family DNA binding protein